MIKNKLYKKQNKIKENSTITINNKNKYCNKYHSKINLFKYHQM